MNCEFLAKFCPTIKLLVFIFVVPTLCISYSHTFVLPKNLYGYHWWHHVVDLFGRRNFANDEDQEKECIAGYN